MQNQSLDISEIITETSAEPSTIMIGDDDKEVLHNLNERSKYGKHGKEIYYFSD